MRAQVRLLPDGRRLHLQDGPIDLILDARGDAQAVGRAYRAAAVRFTTLLDELCAELPMIRAPADPTPYRGSQDDADRLPGRQALPPFGEEPADRPAEGDTPDPRGFRPHPRFAQLLSSKREGRDFERPTQAERICDGGRSRLAGVVARRMEAAVLPFAAETFITPMAAVAGAVAEEILDAMTSTAKLRRASVNNGGDIALHLGPGESIRIGMVDRTDRPGLFGHVDLAETSLVRGVATSGCRGRSFSLGLADAVTVLARTAAEADAAATVVANAVDLPGHPAVTRVQAAALQPDSDLGARLVTRVVGALAPHEIDRALAAGQHCARDLVRRDLIVGAALHLQGLTRTVGGHGLRVTLRPRVVEPLRLRA